jgi:SAM-dependent methyltransferase
MTLPAWHFVETVPRGVDYQDPRLAAEYDRQHARYRDFEREARGIGEALRLGTDDVVVELGAGTGALAVPLARGCRRLYAVEPSPAMLGRLEEKARAAGVANLVACPGGFLTYRHAGEPADAVYSVAALHHLPDFWKQLALRRAAELLRPDGRFYLFDVVFAFAPEEHARHLDAWVGSVREKAGEAFAAEVEAHVREEFSTFEWVLTGMLERAGFRVDEVRRNDPVTAGYLCTRLR